MESWVIFFLMSWGEGLNINREAMLLQFELDGQSCDAASYTFKLEHALSFSSLNSQPAAELSSSETVGHLFQQFFHRGHPPF